MNNLKKIMIAFVLSCTLLEGEEYTFGDGFQLGDSPVIIGGYLSSVYGIEKDSRVFDIDDLALLAYGEFDQYDFLAEFEATDLYRKEYGAHADESSSSTFHIERLYGDYYFGENEQLRVGKFNSDVGFWNQMPINVLRDTTSSPNLVKDFFPKLTTGIHYESRQPDRAIRRLSLTLQPTGDIDREYNNFTVDRHYAFACDVGEKETLWRFGGGYFRYLPAHEALYALGAFRMEKKGWDFLFESIVRRDTHDDKLSYDVYAQGVWHWMAAHDAILRMEVEKAPLTRLHDTTVVAGYTYRPLSNVALKGEYEAHQESRLNRWLFSLSLLF